MTKRVEAIEDLASWCHKGKALIDMTTAELEELLKDIPLDATIKGKQAYDQKKRAAIVAAIEGKKEPLVVNSTRA